MKHVTHGSEPQVTLDEFKAWKAHARGLASLVSLDPRLQADISAGASTDELRDAQARLD